MIDNFHDLVDTLAQIIEIARSNPAPDSPEGKLLCELIDACNEFERENFPEGWP